MVDKKAALAVFRGSLKLKKNETCLIVTDPVKEHIAQELYRQALTITEKVKMRTIPAGKEHGEEPPEEISELMKKFDVEVLVTSCSLTHTKARREATARGVRIATMPDVLEQTIDRCVDIDYERLNKDSRELSRLLEKTGEVRIVSAKGTDLKLTLGATEFFGNKGGLLDRPGDYGNLPEGEVAFAPESCEGMVVIDGTFPGIGFLEDPLVFKVEAGFVNDISGSCAGEVKRRLDKIGKAAYKVAELGIGLNPKAKMVGNILEDEKVLGTVHVAMGNDLSFGKDNDVPIHLDGVIRSPSIFCDGKRIMTCGKFEVRK